MRESRERKKKNEEKTLHPLSLLSLRFAAALCCEPPPTLLTWKYHPVDRLEQPAQFSIRDIEADRHRSTPGGLDPFHVGRCDIRASFLFFGTFFLFWKRSK